MRPPPALAALLLVVAASGACPGAPVELSLNGEWDFTWTPASADDVPTPPPASAFDVKAQVPGQWDDQGERFKTAQWWDSAQFTSTLGPMRYLTGVGWYRRAIDAPGDWRGRAIRLTVGWAIGPSHVWLNGEHVASYDYGVYTPCAVDLSSHIRPGEANELIISVDNTRGFAGGWAFYGNPGKASGITRPVTLEVAAGPGRIDDLYIRPGDDLKEVVCEVELATPTGARHAPESKLVWEVKDAAVRKTLARGAVDVPAFDTFTRLAWRTRIDELQPWSPRQPNLYWAEVRWVVNGEEWDTHRQRFGLRRWSNNGRKLLLNGKPIYLRGEFSALYFPIDCMTPTSKRYWVEHIEAAKRIGMNYINFAARVCPLEMLEAADELGIIVQCGDHMTVLKPYRDRYEEVWSPIVRWTRNHPSMCFYGFGGERNYYEGIIEQYRRQYDLIKSLHPECLVMPQQAIRGIDYAFDEEGRKELASEPFPHHAGRLARYTNACDLFGHYSGGAFGYTYFHTPWQEMEKRFVIYDKPVSIHELFMGMSYLSPDNAAKYTGRVPPYLYTKLGDDLAEAGLLDRWPTYHANSCKLQAICQKYCLEKARKCNEPAGYEYLGMIDQYFAPHYSTGLLDEFFQTKPGETVEGILRYNNHSVLLLDFSDAAEGSINRSYWAETPFDADVMVSLYGPTPIERGELTCRLEYGDQTALERTWSIADIGNGRVTTLHRLSLTWPAVERATQLNLSVRLVAPGYDLANDWDFWVFPKLTPPDFVAAADKTICDRLAARYPGLRPIADGSDEALRIVSALADASIAHLEQGGDVLLLGTEPFFDHSGWTSFRPGLGSRLHHNAGTVIAQHPIFATLPHEGWGDWQFYPVLEGAPYVLFDEEMQTGFDPILERISCGGDVRKQAAVFEKRVGPGRLFVSTCVYDPDNPSCVALMDGILRYLIEDEFQPPSELPLAALRRLAAPLPPMDPENLAGGAPGFEYRNNVRKHWGHYGADYEIDTATAHSGEQSLRMAIRPEDLTRDPGHHTGAVVRNIRFKRTPETIKVSAWHRAENITAPHDRNFLIFIYITYMDGGRYTLRMPFEPGTHDWQYAEKLWQPERDIASATLYIGLAHSTGTAWIDDVYFGPAPQPDEPAIAAEPPNVTWSREPVTIEFGRRRRFCVNGGEWQAGERVRIAQEGITTVILEPDEDDEKPQMRRVGIDATPPVIALETKPTIGQEGGMYFATPDTTFAFKADDAVSGVEVVEVSIDGEGYAEYRAPLRLGPGVHQLRCRATDAAGNRGETITGTCLSGGKAEVVQVTVRQ